MTYRPEFQLASITSENAEYQKGFKKKNLNRASIFIVFTEEKNG